METKCCSACGETKLKVYFVKYKSYCKECRNLRQREFRLSNKKMKIEENEKTIGKGNRMCYYCEKNMA